MYCPKCGNKNADGAQFCASCGEKLNAPQDAQQAPATSTVATKAATTGEGSTAVAANNNGRIIGIVVAVAVIVAVVIAGFATNWFGFVGAQPKAPVEVEASSEDTNVTQCSDEGGGYQGAVKSAAEAYSWEELSQISQEIVATSDEASAIEIAKKYNLCTPDGKLDGTQTKSFTLSDGTKTYVQIAGFWHDDKTDGGKAGITFIFKDAIAEHDMNSGYTNPVGREIYTNAGGWERSAMRSWLSSNVLGMLPEDLRGKIVAVDKLTNNVGETTDISSVTTTSDKLWLYSATELCGTIGWYSDPAYNDILNAEGSVYKLFRDSNVNSNGSNAILTKTLEGESCYWWGRSPIPYISDVFFFVGTGGYPGVNYADGADGVVPGFCI